MMGYVSRSVQPKYYYTCTGLPTDVPGFVCLACVLRFPSHFGVQKPSRSVGCVLAKEGGRGGTMCLLPKAVQVPRLPPQREMRGCDWASGLSTAHRERAETSLWEVACLT